jgi:hypothetical protein
VLLVAALLVAGGDRAVSDTQQFQTGKPAIQSISTLEFGPDGVLFVGDSKAGAIFAIDTGDREPGDRDEPFAVRDVETKLAAKIGTTAEDVLIHDMAVNPISRTAYISVSRSRAAWDSRWKLPNDLADAVTILRIHTDDSIDEFDMSSVPYAMVSLPDPVDLNKEHQWKKGVKVRVDAITDLVYTDGKLYASGLSNEEFAAAFWQVDYPFAGDAKMTTLEIFHGAHGEWETASPIRTFLPYELNGKPHIVAAYLCTPLVTFAADDLAAGGHVKGKTVAEFGSGNFSLDMVLARHGDKEFIVMANSMLPLMTYSPEDIAEYNAKPGIERESPTYQEGVPYIPRSGNGVQQLDNYNDKFLAALQRQPSGKMDLVAVSLEWLAY